MSAEQLAQQSCVPCRGGIPPMEETKARKMLEDLPGWELFHNGERIRRRFQADSFREAIDFVEDVAELAEEQGHHPDFAISGREVNVIFWTHAIDGLHENDFIMAAKVNEVAKARFR